ncbi:MAG: hypothetical protein JXR68_12860 [Bacteroidales bacterium]|nr:hypothetical protein [Bacteroidales bacterium]
MKNKILIAFLVIFVGSFAYSQKTIVVLPFEQNTNTNITELYGATWLENNLKQYIDKKNYVIDIVSSQIFAQTLQKNISDKVPTAYTTTANTFGVDYLITGSFYFIHYSPNTNASTHWRYMLTINVVNPKTGNILFSDAMSLQPNEYADEYFSKVIEYINKH